jgi:hypothetical protein
MKIVSIVSKIVNAQNQRDMQRCVKLQRRSRAVIVSLPPEQRPDLVGAIVGKRYR